MLQAAVWVSTFTGSLVFEIAGIFFFFSCEFFHSCGKKTWPGRVCFKPSLDVDRYF